MGYKDKNRPFSVYAYGSSYISIDVSRLKTFVKVGDIIEGNERFLCTSASYTQFRVTFVDHWGVMAVPTEEYLKHLEYLKESNPSRYSRAKGHHKFKWCNITAIKFIAL